MAEKVKVAHRRLKSAKVTTRFGEFELDALGQFEVEEAIADQLCTVYNVTFDKVAPRAAVQKPAVAAAPAEEAEEEDEEVEDEDEPAEPAGPAKAASTQKKSVRANGAKKYRRQAW